MRVAAELFEEITRFPSITRPAPRRRCSRRIAPRSRRWSGTGRVLIEFGSGSSRKTSLLDLARSARSSAYIPIDIAAESLQEAAGVAVAAALMA